MKRFYIISTLILWVTIVGYSQVFSPENAKLDAGRRLALLFGDTVSFEDVEQDTKRLAAQGEKAYKKIREYIEKEEYRKALDTFETHMVDIYLYFVRSDNNVYPFYEDMIELYYQELDEEEAIKKDIYIRQFCDIIMEEIFAIRGRVPVYYYPNANKLSNIYYKQKDYNMAADIANRIVSVFEQTGDTICTAYAMALSNLGTVYWRVLCSTIDSLGIDELENEPDDVVDILRQTAMSAIDLQRKANAIYNSIPEMKYSEENNNVLLLILEVYSVIQETPDLQTLEQVRAIYEKNNWETDFYYSMARLNLLFTYIEMGEMQKAKELYAVIKAEDEENKLPSFKEIVDRINQL